MKTWIAVALAAVLTNACKGSNSCETGSCPATDANSGSGVPMACDIQLTSSVFSGSTSASYGGSCTPSDISPESISLQFEAKDQAGDDAMVEIACTLTSTTVPQTLGSRSSSGSTGCNVEIDSFIQMTGASDMWSSTPTSSVDIVVTDIPTASGTIDITLYDSMNVAMDVMGTF
jgi:hypothetical protein